MKLKSLLKNKTVLYVICFLAITNVLGLLFSRNWLAVALFCLSGYIGTYFSKNMIVILLSAMLLTNFLIVTNVLRQNVEAMSNRRSQNKKRKMGPQPASEQLEESEVDGKNEVDYASSLEKAYDNLDGLIGKKGVSNMAEHTKRLASKQKQLIQNMQTLGPTIENAKKMMENLPLDKIDQLQETMGSMGNLVGKFSSLKQN